MNVILDIGAAMNAYKMIWNYPHKFANCVVHSGDFHAMKENYCVIGNIVAASGFEDVVFQSGLCTSGSVQGIRTWVIHSAVSEAMERLLLNRFSSETGTSFPQTIGLMSANTGDMSLSDMSLSDSDAVCTEA